MINASSSPVSPSRRRLGRAGLAVVSALALCAAADAANAAGSARVWVSGKGADAAGCGSPATPCRSLQYAHDHIVAAGGEIDILDPAGYGALTITKAVSIVNDGVGEVGSQGNGGSITSAITVHAGANDAVYIKGLTVEGAGTTANGINFVSGKQLTI